MSHNNDNNGIYNNYHSSIHRNDPSGRRGVKRGSYCKQDDKLTLFRIIEKYKKIVLSKRIDAITNKNKTEAWQMITNEFNLVSYVPKNEEQLKNIYRNKVSEIKRLIAKGDYDRLTLEHKPFLEFIDIEDIKYDKNGSSAIAYVGISDEDDDDNDGNSSTIEIKPEINYDVEDEQNQQDNNDDGDHEENESDNDADTTENEMKSNDDKITRRKGQPRRYNNDNKTTRSNSSHSSIEINQNPPSNNAQRDVSNHSNVTASNNINLRNFDKIGNGLPNLYRNFWNPTQDQSTTMNNFHHHNNHSNSNGGFQTNNSIFGNNEIFKRSSQYNHPEDVNVNMNVNWNNNDEYTNRRNRNRRTSQEISINGDDNVQQQRQIHEIQIQIMQENLEQERLKRRILEEKLKIHEIKRKKIENLYKRHQHKNRRNDANVNNMNGSIRK